MTQALMVLGTSSSAGKSLLAAGICRCLHRAGVRVAPFKAQNMSNNAAVTVEGGEIGRAQALQARACGLLPSSDMNPVLLKPSGPRRSQVIVQGKVLRDCDAATYHELAPTLWPRVTESYERLAANYDVIVIEGAGSCAELNITWDFTNLKIAHHAKADCFLVGDIDRGGIFAQLIGTLALLSNDSRALFRGSIINKFRGDRSLLKTAAGLIEEKSGVPVTGILPFLSGLAIEEEDSMEIPVSQPPRPDAIAIDILKLPHISNFTDFAALGRELDVTIRYVDVAGRESLNEADVIVIPGSKNTIEDLETLRRHGYADQILRSNAEIVGICGGLQMLGTTVADPNAIESDRGSAQGLGLLQLETTLLAEKTTRASNGEHGELGAWSGYEIHCGETTGDAAVMMTDFSGRAVGYTSSNAWGSYIHGIFDNDEFRGAWLRRCRVRKGLSPDIARTPLSLDSELDRVADAIREHLHFPAPWNAWL